MYFYYSSSIRGTSDSQILIINVARVVGTAHDFSHLRGEMSDNNSRGK